MAAGTFVGAIQSVLTPKFTALLSDPTGFNALLYRWTRGTFFVALGVAFAILALAWLIEQFLLPVHYKGFVMLLLILLIKFVLWASYAVGGAALVGAGVIKSGTLIALITTVIAFASGYPLIKYLGIWGAAWMQVLVAGASFLLVQWTLRLEIRKLSAIVRE
jgi:O-antigen/teichoic acid export membrane protein